MKIIISIIAGLLTAWGVFYLDSLFINWLIKDISPEIYTISKIILWLFAIAWTAWIAILSGITIGTFVKVYMDYIEYNREMKKRRKQWK